MYPSLNVDASDDDAGKFIYVCRKLHVAVYFVV